MVGHVTAKISYIKTLRRKLKANPKLFTRLPHAGIPGRDPDAWRLKALIDKEETALAKRLHRFIDFMARSLDR